MFANNNALPLYVSSTKILNSYILKVLVLNAVNMLTTVNRNFEPQLFHHILATFRIYNYLLGLLLSLIVFYNYCDKQQTILSRFCCKNFGCRDCNTQDVLNTGHCSLSTAQCASFLLFFERC